VKAKTDRIDIVHAGLAELVPVEAITQGQFDRMFDINVKGLLFTVQKACLWFMMADRSS
jgi:NAD(P)-dependent dehydrogenase (short-subunit alcohol dehydrogenase family)